MLTFVLKRIAFAVILENAGYGGSTAAAAAGEIVSAASSLADYAPGAASESRRSASREGGKLVRER